MKPIAPHITRGTASGAAGRQPVYALVGNPNCGKSTLFNALTGLKQKVGNYPGVTVEKKEGVAYSQHGQPMTVIDLPGAYSLAARSPDEAVTRDVLLGRRADTPMPDRILCIVDATNLERNLYLVHQILDLGRPVIVSQHANTFSAQGDVLLVDLSYYQTITKAGGMQTATSMHLYFDADLTAFRTTFRMDGQSKLSAPITPAKGSTTMSPFVQLGAR